MTVSDHSFEYHIKANLVTLACMCAVPFALMALVSTVGQGWTRHSRVDKGREVEVIFSFNPHPRTCLLTFRGREVCSYHIYAINDYCFIIWDWKGIAVEHPMPSFSKWRSEMTSSQGLSQVIEFHNQTVDVHCVPSVNTGFPNIGNLSMASFSE